MKSLKINWLLWIQALLFLGAVFLLYHIISNYSEIFSVLLNFLRIISPVLVGFVIAYFLSGACKLFERLIRRSKNELLQKRAGGISVAIVYLLAVGLIYLTGSFLIPLIIQNLIDFLNSLPELYRQVRDWAYGLDLGGVTEFVDLEEQINTFFQNFTIDDVTEHVQFGVASISGFVIDFTSGVFNAVIATIISIYTLLHKKKILAMVNRVVNIFIKEPRLSRVRAYFALANEMFYKFIKAQFLDACILGFLATILLTVLDVRFAVALGLFLGVCNMIPQFGSIFGTIVVIILTFITGTGTQALLVAVFLIILQQIDANVISPKIMGNALKINPILVISSLIIGGAYFGVIGMFVSIPIMAMLKIFFIDALEKREIANSVMPSQVYNVDDMEFDDGMWEDDVTTDEPSEGEVWSGDVSDGEGEVGNDGAASGEGEVGNADVSGGEDEVWNEDEEMDENIIDGEIVSEE